MDTVLWLTLSKIKGMGKKRMVSLFNINPNLTLDDVASGRMNPLLIKLIKNKVIVEKLNDFSFLSSLRETAADEIKKHQELGIEIITYPDIRYPEMLRQTTDPPAVLYCKGSIKALGMEKKMAVIGARDATPGGIETAKEVAGYFAARGYAVVSGLARGIDTAAHEAALQAQGITIAVLPGSLDKIYPKENEGLAERILKGNGLLVSEYPLGAGVMKGWFVDRDRIQSGLSLGVCPVQTDIDGATMHTVRYAEEYKRSLFCPRPLGPECEPAYRGIHKLINEKRADVVDGQKDLERIDPLLHAKMISFKKN